VSRLLLRALGISIAEYSSLKTIRVLHTISGLLHPLSLLREPRHSPCFPRQKLFSYNKLGLYFMIGRAKPNQRSVLSPFLAVCCPIAKHITATVACCLQSSGRVATIYILHVLLKISGIFRLFLELCLAYIPAPNWVQLQRGTYAN
jgi:hypothetical protein